MKRKIPFKIAIVLILILLMFIQREQSKEKEGLIKYYHKAAVIEKSTENGIEYFLMMDDLVYERFTALELKKSKRMPMGHWKYQIFIPDATTSNERGKQIVLNNGKTSRITMYDDLIEIDGVVYENDPEFELMEWIEFFYDYHSKNYEIGYVEDRSN